MSEETKDTTIEESVEEPKEETPTSEEPSNEEPNDSTDTSTPEDDIDDDLPDFDSMTDEEFENYLDGVDTSKKQSNRQNTPVVKEPISQPKPEPKKVNTPKEQVKEEVTDQSSDDYKEFYKRVLTPFKANGKEIAPRNIDDVISLMQMGANYTKKMQSIAPMRKAIESLKKANISQDDLNFLIDIHKGNPEAIKKLMKDKKIDPLEYDMDEESKYVPSNNLATDQDVEFSEVIDDIHDSIPKIRDILDNTWDDKSKQKVLNDPKLLKALHEEIQYGRFDKIQSILEQEKTFGRYKEMSDIDAYTDIVTKLYIEQQKQQKANAKKVNTEQEEIEALKKNNKPKLDKSKAAPTRIKSKPNKGGTLSNQDLWALSDEEFEKLNLKDLEI